jgi:AmmeMemoRadiSam system protein A
MKEDELKFLDQETGKLAVGIARVSLEQFVRKQTRYKPSLVTLPLKLRQQGACFITLTNKGVLRGCIGHTDPLYPLAEDIARNAMAASRDFRFPPVTVSELDTVKLEVTVLTPLIELHYENIDDLYMKLRPGIDGVMLSWQKNRGLLLPQVWKRIPEPASFLEAILQKAGIPSREIRSQPPCIQVHRFQVQHFAEVGYLEPGL